MNLYENEDLYNTLKQLGVIESTQLEEALTESQNKNLPLGEILLEKDLISDENLGKLLADTLGFSFVNLHKVAIPDEVLKIIPEIVAKKQKVVAFNQKRQ